MASMAVAVVPWPVMKMTGMRESMPLSCRNTSKPGIASQIHVQNDDIRLELCDFIETFLRPMRPLQINLRPGKSAAEEMQNRRFIVNDKKRRHVKASMGRNGRSCNAIDRQAEQETCACFR